jgi:hypothetical protein
MDKVSIALLISSLILGIGGWMQTLSSWGAATNPANMAGLLLILGGVILNWINKSPLSSKPPSDGKA